MTLADDAPQAAQRTLSPISDTPSADELAQWFETLLRVQRAAAGSRGFYDQTARAVVDLVHLDRGSVLLLRDDDWETASEYPPPKGTSRRFSRTVLEQVRREKRTFFRGIDRRERMNSLVNVDTVVASPMFDSSGEVCGVVYGTRVCSPEERQLGIRPWEAQLVQLLAAAVSAGLARLDVEAEAARTRVQFEQVFSPQLVRELEQNPGMLDGHDQEVSVLFADIRSFSRISEKLGARETYRMLRDVMDALTDAIMDAGGVMIDYHGDGLAAMWNAPRLQADHPRLACEASRRMLAVLPEVSARWESVIGFPLRIGIGIHTGRAQVGNAGSRRRMKYGPLGPTVNLASRVEGATKLFQVPVLLTGQVIRALGDTDRTRRLATVRVVGIEEPVTLFEFHPAEVTATWRARCDAYEQALDAYERGEAQMAHDILELAVGEPEFAEDLPLRGLLRRIRSTLDQTLEQGQTLETASRYDTVWQLSAK